MPKDLKNSRNSKISKKNKTLNRWTSFWRHRFQEASMLCALGFALFSLLALCTYDPKDLLLKVGHNNYAGAIGAW
ncbi:MAG: DNA translocase FtsK 4TM domain-containing protein, partial [Gammaproteobacteria bacterium]